MRWSDINWQTHGIMEGRQHAHLVFGAFTLSIITEDEEDLYECAILNETGNLMNLPGINEPTEEWDDDVLRWQTKEEVIGVIRKLESITGQPPKL
jgi:hypothetical protein